MKEFVEKLIEKLEEETDCPNCSMHCMDANMCGFDEMRKQAINTIRELAKEYNNGWIPCSEKLPVKNQRCLIHYINNDYIDVDTFDGERFSFFGMKGVIAWQPLPPAYNKTN